MVSYSSGLFDGTIAQAATSFLATFDGAPANPKPFDPTDWDITVLSHGDNEERPMVADHGADCAAPPATHVVTRDDDMVFQCNNHIMTAVNAGYGAVYLTPNAMLDFSAGEAVLKWDMSTNRTSSRDWIDLVLMPWEENLQVNFQDVHYPQDAVHLNMGGANVFIPSVFRNYTETVMSTNLTTFDVILANHGLSPSATRRDTFELHVSPTHMKFMMPAYGFTWFDEDISPPLTWNQAVIQLNHRSYNPEKACIFDGTCAANTWHWDNVSISPAAPFTILRADRRVVNKNATTVNFGAPSPANARLRFAGSGEPITYSLDGGRTWLNPTIQGRPSGKPEVGDAFWTPIPPGITSVQFQGTQLGSLDWGIIDTSIWAPGNQPIDNVAPVFPARGTPPAWPVTVTFDDLSASPNPNLEGEYPAGVIDWGTDAWALGNSGTNNSVHFSNPDPFHESFNFVNPAHLVQLDATNNGTSTSTVTLHCYGQADVSASVAPGQTVTINTNWTANCPGMTVDSSNIYNTSFDNLVVTGSSAGAPPATSTPVPPPTPTPLATSSPLPGVTSTPAAQAVVTLTFDELSNPNRPLSGQYPGGVVDWGTNAWYLSGPFGAFATNSIGFNGAGPTSATFSFVSPGSLVQLDAFNGGNVSSTITLSCAGQSTVTTNLDVQRRLTIVTGWGGTCSSVTVGSSNGWDTNFDNVVLSSAAPAPMPTSTPTPPPQSQPLTVNFNNLSNPNRPLNGQYPTGVIDWGTNAWYLSGPFGAFTTNSIGFNGNGPTSASFNFVNPRQLLQVDAFNGGGGSSTITLSCAGQPTVSRTLAVHAQATITTGWSGTCTTVTVGSTNGWKTNFDNLVIQ
jgi:hypothetical protein